jgi:uncharacterized membrane protein YqaE (UPF0057 family)
MRRLISFLFCVKIRHTGDIICPREINKICLQEVKVLTTKAKAVFSFFFQPLFLEFERYGTLANLAVKMGNCCAYLCALFLPPVGVLLADGCGSSLCINILLTLFFFIPGVIHACCVISASSQRSRDNPSVVVIHR